MWTRNGGPNPATGPQTLVGQRVQRTGPAPAAKDKAADAIDLGTSVVVKGHLAAFGDLTIEGHVEGTIEVQDYTLTVGRNVKIDAQVLANIARIGGTVKGNVTATAMVEILETGSLHGNIVAPQVAIAEGAYFRGTVDMHPLTREKVGVSRLVPATVAGLATEAGRDRPAKTA